VVQEVVAHSEVCFATARTSVKVLAKEQTVCDLIVNNPTVSRSAVNALLRSNNMPVLSSSSVSRLKTRVMQSKWKEDDLAYNVVESGLVRATFAVLGSTSEKFSLLGSTFAIFSFAIGKVVTLTGFRNGCCLDRCKQGEHNEL
jgi:hypothetical protein